MIEIGVIPRLLLSVLAAFKIAELVVIEEGPFSMFSRFRRFVGQLAAKSSSNRPGVRTVSTELADWVNCPFCVGVWASFLLTVLILIPSVPGDILIIAMGLAGGQSFLQQQSIRKANE